MKRSTVLLLACFGLAASVQAQSTGSIQPGRATTRGQIHQPNQTWNLVQVDGNLVLQAVPGDHEFSGRIIARPIQPDVLANRGMSKAEMIDFANRAKNAALVYDLYDYEPLVDYYVLELPEGETEAQAINTLMATGLFEYVEPDWTLYPIGCPDDSNLGAQWHHNSNRMA